MVAGSPGAGCDGPGGRRDQGTGQGSRYQGGDREAEPRPGGGQEILDGEALNPGRQSPDLTGSPGGAAGGRPEPTKADRARLRHAALEARWSRLLRRYLPLGEPGSRWRSNRAPLPGEPTQGWKLHVAVTVLSAPRGLAAVAPVLAARDVPFKASASIAEINRLNTGIEGYSQVGKTITVYPRSEEEALELAAQLHRLTLGLACPEVPYDRRYRPGSCVFYRYGGFASLTVRDRRRGRVDAIRGPAGRLLPDLREPGRAVPSWLRDPFVTSASAASSGASAGGVGPLATTYRAYEALSHRGKGGVFKALDLGSETARRCVIKEGLRHGEVDMLGRDGRRRIIGETATLRALSRAEIGVPTVHASFDTDGHRYLVLEHIEGEGLDAVLAGRRPSLRRALRLGRELAGLLEVIHAAGWAWRDCKPSNLIVVSGDRLRPVDFEGSCRLGATAAPAWATELYSAPGNPWGERRDWAKEDSYGLGAVLYQLLGGSRSESSREFRHLPRAGPRLNRLIRQLTAVKPGARPSAGDARARLEAELQRRASDRLV